MKLSPGVIAAIAAVLIAAGVAVAQSSGNDNVYTGCLTDHNVILKVSIGDEPAEPCAEGETQVSWNQSGPEGPQGEAGPAGSARRTRFAR